MPSARLRAVIIVAISLSLAGCAGAPSVAPVARSPHAFPQAGQSFVMHPGATGQLIYGCVLNSGTCVWFDKGSDAIAGQINTLSDPAGIGVDPSTGDLFIANAGASNIVKFAPGSTTPLATFSDAGEFPNDVAVGTNGDVYVANFSTTSRGPGTITVYDPSGNVLRTLTDPRVLQGESVTLDEKTDLVFCFRNTSRLGECDDFPGARGHGVERASGWKLPGGSTFDAAEHLVEVDTHLAHILTYNGSTRCGKATLTGSPIPTFIALDRPNQLLYDVDASTGLITAYDYSDCANGSLTVQMQYNVGLPAGALISVAVTPGVTP